jgi:hypothetical protein
MASRLVAVVVVCAAFGLSTAWGQTSLGTAFTYQGQLKQNGTPVNGTVTLQFSLWDAPGGGNQLGVNQSISNIPISDGLFTVRLNAAAQFGVAAFNGEARYLEIEVCADPICAGGTTLSPRQPLTPTPYATFAAAPWITSGTSVFYTGGMVGIGTAAPNKTLTVNGDIGLGVQSSDYHHLRIGGGNSDGFLYGSFPHFGDGIHLGYNYFADAAGANHVINPAGGTSRISFQYGALVLATAPPFGGEPIQHAALNSAGDFGIGTVAPVSKLDVRGDIRLGSNGQYLAPGAEENLRIVRGTCSAVGCTGINIDVGTGFTAAVLGDGRYRVTFTTPFNGLPTVTASAKPSGCDAFATIVSVTNLSADIHITVNDCSAGACAAGFHFIAVGLR